MASAFTDVEEGRWSEGCINAANANGIVIGRGNGVFDPKANVTSRKSPPYCCAVGYDETRLALGLLTTTPKQSTLGTEYVDYIGPKAATRGEVLLCNGSSHPLDCPLC